MLKEKINFKAQPTEPNPKEVDYWVNTSVDPNGGEIRYYNGKQWKTIHGGIKWSMLLQQYSLATMTIDDANSDPVIPVTGDTSWIKGRRCLAKPMDDGSVAIAFLHEDDSYKYADGSDARLDGSEGEFMVYFPETWVKCTEVDGVTTVEVSNGDNGGAYFRSVLLGAVHTVGDSTMSRAIPNFAKPQVSLTIKQAHDAVINTFGEGWSIMDYEARNKVTLMAYAKYGTRNLQSVVGLGDSNYGFVEGVTASLGNKDGELTNTDGYICNSMLGIENYFNNVADWLGGIHQVLTPDSDLFYIYDGVQVDAENGIPSTLYRTINPSSTGLTEQGNITKMMLGKYADLFPVKTDGNTSGNFDTYYADAGMFFVSDNDSIVSSGYLVTVVFVGSYGAYPVFGGGFFSAGSGPSGAGDYCGSRLLFRGKINEFSNINQFKALPSLDGVN